MSRAPTLVLVLAGLAACHVCDPPREPFVTNFDLTESDVREILVGWGVPRGEVTCEQACMFAHEAATTWMVTEIESCTLDLDPTEGSTDLTPVGNVLCEGEAIEYACD